MNSNPFIAYEVRHNKEKYYQIAQDILSKHKYISISGNVHKILFQCTPVIIRWERVYFLFRGLFQCVKNKKDAKIISCIFREMRSRIREKLGTIAAKYYMEWMETREIMMLNKYGLH